MRVAIHVLKKRYFRREISKHKHPEVGTHLAWAKFSKRPGNWVAENSGKRQGQRADRAGP